MMLNVGVLEAAIGVKEVERLIDELEENKKKYLLKVFAFIHESATKGDKVALKPIKIIKYHNKLMTSCKRSTLAKSMFVTLKK